MNDLKADRTAAKTKVTTSASRLERSIGNQPERLLNSYYDQLVEAHYAFLDLDAAYNTILDEQEELKEKFATVNQLDSTSYTAEVVTIYNKAKLKFSTYFRDEAKLEVHDLCGKLEKKLEEIDSEEDSKVIKVKLDVVKDLTSQVTAVGKRKVGHADADWGEVEIAIKKTVERSEEVQVRANLKLDQDSDKLLLKSQTATSSSVPQTAAQVITTTSPDSPPTTSNQANSTQSTHPPSSGGIYTSAGGAGYSQPPYMTPAQLLIAQYQPNTSSGTGLQQSSPQFGHSGLLPTPNTGMTSTSSPGPGVQQSSPQFGHIGLLPTPNAGMTPMSSIPTAFGGMPISSLPISTSAFTAYQYPGSTPQSPLMPPSSPFPSYPLPEQRPHFPEVKVRRAELPIFSGERRHWPEFRTMWPRLAIPAFPSKETLADQLRNCVKGDAAGMISTVTITGPDAFDRMWNKLALFYEDAAASVEAALKKMYQKLRSVPEEDYRGFVSLVDEVEIAYTQLVNWDQLNCLSNRDVNNISKFLPPTMRMQWKEIFSQRLSPGERLHSFPSFMNFLVTKRVSCSLLAEEQVSTRKSASHFGSQSKPVKKVNNPSEKQKVNSPAAKSKFPKCAVHKSDPCKHSTVDCADFKSLELPAKYEALRSIHACFRCFGDHRRSRCREKEPCKKCEGNHHTLLCKIEAVDSNHNSLAVVSDSNHAVSRKSVGLYAVASVGVKSSKKRSTVFLDNGSDSSWVTDEAARRLGAKKLGKYVLEVTTTGGNETIYESQLYSLDLITSSGKIVTVELYGINKITGKLAKLNLINLTSLFPGYEVSALQRERTEVDILLGTDYFGLHPKRELASAGENLSIMEGAFGITLQGSHPDIQEETTMDSNMVRVVRSASPLVISTGSHLTIASEVKHPLFIQSGKLTGRQKCATHLTASEEMKIDKYIEGEELPIQVNPKCGACRCGTCPQPGHTYSFNEEVQLKLIQNNLNYKADSECWETSYPWKSDPEALPESKNIVKSCLRRLEKKLQKNEKLAETYQEQIQDMISRGVARELSQQEIEEYKGPHYYISHLGVPNPKSKTTPFRIVFNSSQKIQGQSLNDSLFKGPDSYMNNQLGVLLRWRENLIAMVGDLKKMYNSVLLKEEEMHCHRFLWTNLNYSSEPKTYVITRVNMGDRPAGAIATEALYKTADMWKKEYPEVYNLVKTGSYVDDLMSSVKTMEIAKSLSSNTEKVLARGNFKVKFWTYSGEDLDEGSEMHVLGVPWKPGTDVITFNLSLNFSPKRQGIHILPDLRADEVPAQIPEVLTKRNVLSQVMRIYDPMGLLSPFTICGKILLRETWEYNTEWDQPISPELRKKWIQLFTEIYDANSLEFPRAITPSDAVGDPILVLFSDASDLACGFVAYARWPCVNNIYKSRVILAKSRVSPLVKRSTPQLELNAALMSKRGREVIMQEMNLNFQKFIHIIDSETVLAMLHKTSTRFPLYEGVRLGEMQASTDGDVSCWAWVAGKKNPADMLTRGRSPKELAVDSEWFSAPAFLQEPEENWGLKYLPSDDAPLPGYKHAVSSNAVTHQHAIDYERFGTYGRLLRTMASVLSVVGKRSILAAKITSWTPDLLEEAEKWIIQDVQKMIKDECEKKGTKGRLGGRFCRLKPVFEGWSWVVGTRMRFNPLALENNPQHLLPTIHPVTRLIMEQAHRDTIHGGRDTTLARFRQRFWATQGSKVAEGVVGRCQLCILKRRKLIVQKMGQLPIERSKPVPPFTFVMCDYFGPFAVRGEVQKRITSKAWGILFTDLVTRAVFIESVMDCSADSFLIALSKFASCRGYPRIMYSDPGSNLECASKELEQQWKKMWAENGNHITSKLAEKGLEWRFSPAEAPWNNGAVESLVKSVKRALSYVMNDQRLTPYEFSGVLYEVANLVNERPKGSLSGADSELSIITPNSLLLGRSQAKNPGGWQPTTTTLKSFRLVQQVTDAFWRHWIKIVAPALVTDSKWHVGSRNLQPGDVVLVLNDSKVKAQYKLARVKETFPDDKGVVRKVLVSYKNYKVGERLVSYTGAADTDILRPVQRLSLIVPVGEEEE